jgi:hypothetical protein
MVNKQMACIFCLLAIALGSVAFADYDDLARRQAQQEYTKEQAAQAARWRASEIATIQSSVRLYNQVVSAVNNFAYKGHHGLASAPAISTSKRVYDTVIIDDILFSTNDHYECKADWAQVTDALGYRVDEPARLQINCISSITGKHTPTYSPGLELPDEFDGRMRFNGT